MPSSELYILFMYILLLMPGKQDGRAAWARQEDWTSKVKVPVRQGKQVMSNVLVFVV